MFVNFVLDNFEMYSFIEKITFTMQILKTDSWAPICRHGALFIFMYVCTLYKTNNNFKFLIFTKFLLSKNGPSPRPPTRCTSHETLVRYCFNASPHPRDIIIIRILLIVIIIVITLPMRANLLEEPLLIAIVDIALSQRQLLRRRMQRHALLVYTMQQMLGVLVIAPWPIDGAQATDGQLDALSIGLHAAFADTQLSDSIQTHQLIVATAMTIG